MHYFLYSMKSKIAVALDFHVFLAQTKRPKKSNFKEAERIEFVVSVGFKMKKTTTNMISF